MSVLGNFLHVVDRKGGVAALVPIKPPGRKSKATPEFLQAMGQAVQTSPLTLGYGFSMWSVARLAKYLAKTTGIQFGVDQLRRLLHQHGFSFQRPKHYRKANATNRAINTPRANCSA